MSKKIKYIIKESGSQSITVQVLDKDGKPRDVKVDSGPMIDFILHNKA